MGLILFLLGIFVLAFFISKTAKFFLGKITRWEERQKQNENPYIKYQKFKSKNDENYDEYLRWMEKHGDGVPVEKFTTPEDAKAEKKYKDLI